MYCRLNTYLIPSGNNRTPGVLCEVFGELRKGISCNWKLYETTLSSRNVEFYVDYYINSYKVLGPYTFPDRTENNSRGITIWNGSLGSQHTENWNGTDNTWITAKDSHMEGNSRGTGNNWAILDCN